MPRIDMETRVRIILDELAKLYPKPKIALNYTTNYELLFAVMLSAQSTDKKINEVTAKVFKKYPTLKSFAEVPIEELEVDLKSTGFFRAKSKNVKAAAQKLIKDFGGEVPQTMKELITLPGVARKTANVVLNVAFNINEGIAVDTHVIRLAQKFGLTQHKDPVNIEKDLMAVIPKDEWGTFNLRLVQYGRDYSPAHKKDSDEDPISRALLLR